MSQQQGSRRRRQQLHPNSRSNPSSPSPTSSTSTSTSSSFEIIASPTHLPDSARSQPILKSASNGKEEHQQQTTVRSVAEMMFGGLKAVNNRFWEVDRKIGRWLHLDVREDEPDEPSEGEDSDNKIILDVDGEFENINNHHHYSSRHNIRNEHSQPARNQNPARNQPPPSYYHDNAQTTSSQLTLLLPAPPIPQTTLERLTSYLPIFPTHAHLLTALHLHPRHVLLQRRNMVPPPILLASHPPRRARTWKFRHSPLRVARAMARFTERSLAIERW